MSERTELPWESTGSIVRRASGTFVPVADTYVSAKNYTPSQKTKEANADFIVRACNERSELIKQRDDLLTQCTNLRTAIVECRVYEPSVMVTLRATIKKATEQHDN